MHLLGVWIMDITYTITENLNDVIGYYDNENYDQHINHIKDNFKYGNCFFESGSILSPINYMFFLAIDNDMIVGVLKFKYGGHDSLGNPGFANWVCFTEVIKEYRNKGIGYELKRMLFDYCHKNNMNILSSGFTLLGHKYSLKGYIDLAHEYGVEYCYIDCVRFPNFNNFEGLDEAEYKAYYDKHKSDWDESKQIRIINKGINHD
jgi:GNAT superfamily N-acetyltransferase